MVPDTMDYFKEIHELPRFCGHDYGIWKMRLNMLLREMDLVSIVEEEPIGKHHRKQSSIYVMEGKERKSYELYCEI